ncbi:MAG TPA: TonB-dependent receptor [Woeseiaceae bacterium]|nr:TonB-dependent receptor [Woeseiaceae bacterium]
MALAVLGAPWPAAARDDIAATPLAVPSSGEVVTYPAEFFQRYNPDSALEMVERLPGFQVDDGADKRGFGGASGNILIDDRYPSAKQDSPSSILDRIPAAQVARIEVIRAQVREIDLRGHAVVANVVLREDIPATSRWEGSIRKNFNHAPLTVAGSVSVSDQWKGIEYVVGAGGRRFASGEGGTELLIEEGGSFLEEHLEDTFLRGEEGSGNLNASTWLGETRVQVNAGYAFENRFETLTSVPDPRRQPDDDSEDFFADDGDVRQLEIGGDAERSFGRDFLAKAILLYTREDKDAVSSQRTLDDAGAQALFRIADSGTVSTEAIARLELYWAGWADHAVQIDLEGARNVIDASLLQNVDTGDGPEPVPVPGANTRVHEDRGDFMISDIWSLGKLELDYGVGAEASTITQEGDARQKRNFFFLKPHLALTYWAAENRHTRLRLAREVSQLDFDDFVSATVFQDDDLALGNPDLRPETTWVAELVEERRYGRLGVVKLKLFHHWISDVQDLLPLSSSFEAPGNIGDGRRWGVELEATVPLDSLGLAAARLDLQARLQDSTVTDPVTGDDRVLSGAGGAEKPIPFRDENRFAFGVAFRQDFQDARVSWGWDARARADRTRFLVNELDVYGDGTELNVFVETTRWFGRKISLSANNLLDFNFVRNRTIFTGERDLSPIARRELQDRTDGRRVLLTVSGSF